MILMCVTLLGRYVEKRYCKAVAKNTNTVSASISVVQDWIYNVHTKITIKNETGIDLPHGWSAKITVPKVTIHNVFDDENTPGNDYIDIAEYHVEEEIIEIFEFENSFRNGEEVFVIMEHMPFRLGDIIITKVVLYDSPDPNTRVAVGEMNLGNEETWDEQGRIIANYKTPIAIDGSVDYAWASAGEVIPDQVEMIGSVTEEIHAVTKALWDYNYLYLLVIVRDMNPTSEDFMEVFLDEEKDANSYADVGHHYILGFDGSVRDGNDFGREVDKMECEAACTGKMLDYEGNIGYVLEAKIKLSHPYNEKIMQYDLKIHDKKETGTRMIRIFETLGEMILKNGPEYIAVDLSFGDLVYEYSNKGWNPMALSYDDTYEWRPVLEGESDKISIRNRSMDEVNVSFYFETFGEKYQNAYGAFFDVEDNLLPQGQPNRIGSLEKKDIYFLVYGTPNNTMSVEHELLGHVLIDISH